LPQGFLIIDKIKGTKVAQLDLRWQGRSKEALGQLSIVCSKESKEEWKTEDEKTGEGWYSPSYGIREPSWVRLIGSVQVALLLSPQWDVLYKWPITNF
jgi:hypothetical protein